MATPATPTPAAQKPMGTAARILDTFIAPTETFTDFKRSTSWWAAFLVLVVCGYVMIFAAANKVGWEQINENQMKLNPKAAERMEQMPPEQRARAVQLQTTVTKYASYGFPVFTLIAIVIVAAVLMGTFNFGFGAQVDFKAAIAIVTFGWLPGAIRSLLTALTLFLGANAENFNFQNPIGSNPGYYMGTESSRALVALLTNVDLFSIWIVVLMGLGFACVSKVKKGTAIGVVAAWYLLITLIGVGFTAAFS